MKLWRQGLIIVGIIGLLISLSLDTSVKLGYERIHNVGLMDEKQNFIIVSGLILLSGVILLASSNTFGRREEPDSLSNQSKAESLADKPVKTSKRVITGIIAGIVNNVLIFLPVIIPNTFNQVVHIALFTMAIIALPIALVTGVLGVKNKEAYAWIPLVLSVPMLALFMYMGLS